MHIYIQANPHSALIFGWFNLSLYVCAISIPYLMIDKVSVADLPGLVDGAHENRGLGHSFLKHVERVEGIVYMIDAAGVDGRSPVDDLTQLLLELELYEPSLLLKPALVFANKVYSPLAQTYIFANSYTC
jgi:GTPase involved in cell partitioning and DNA repair